MKNTGARLVLMLLIIWLMLSSCSLNREHIELPDVNDIEAVSIEYFNTESIVVETDSAIERIYDSLSSARAVRTEKDIPTGGSFFTITIFDNDGGESTLGYYQCAPSSGFMFIGDERYEVSRCDMEGVWEDVQMSEE